MKIRNLTLFATACLVCLGASAQAQTRILPLGDSVTSSYTPNLSYRYWLWHQLNEAGYNVDFVGTQWGVDGGAPGSGDFDQHHEGHPGWTTSDAAFYIDSIAASTVPDVVLLDIGANDVGSGIPASESQTNIMHIIEGLRAVNPNVVILLAQTTPFVGQDKAGMSRLRGAVKRAAKLEKKQGANVRVVNLAGGFNLRRDTNDGTHPNELGEQKIAKKYFAALRKVL